MHSSRNINEAVQQLAGTKNSETVKLVTGEVISVDENKRTCNVSVIGVSDFDITNVSLMTGINDGYFIIPKVGSQILVCYNNRNIKYICQFSEIEKVLIIINKTTFEIVDGSIKINDGTFNGIVKIDDLTTKINDMINFINAEFLKIQTGIITGGGAYTPTNLQAFNKSDYENDKITHGE